MNDFLTVQTSGFVTYCDALIARFGDGPAQALLFSLIGSPTQVQAASAHFYNGGGLLSEIEALDPARIYAFHLNDLEDLPKEALAAGKSTFRSLKLNEEMFEFSDGFADLHTEVYRQVLADKGFGIDAARPSIELAHQIRSAVPIGLKGEYHSLAKSGSK